MAMAQDRSRSRGRRFSSIHSNSTSASTSPERPADDDNESFTMQGNDSVSSLGLSEPEQVSDAQADEIKERGIVSPISRLPAEIMIAIFQKLPHSSDYLSCMLVSREWARNSVGLLWHRPQTGNWPAVHNVVQTVRSAHAFFDYDHLVKRLNLSTLGPQVSDGTLMAFAGCKRIERLTLTNCTKLSDLSVHKVVQSNRALMALDVTGMENITDTTMHTVARYCYRLQGLNITNCRKITDESLEDVAQNCRHIKRLKFNGCHQLTDRSIIAFAQNCRHLLEIDLADCRRLEDDAVTALISESTNLRELRLAHCVRITDNAFLNLPFDITFESLRILDLTDCGELQDAGVQKIISAAPRLRNLVLAKCRQITDRAVMAITRLAKNLHYIHLGHCARITDAGVLQLVNKCNRIRYIDLACCSNLTDASITQLATLPKLKRIGLVKCMSITDMSIYALAKPRSGSGVPPGSPTSPTPSSLERVHLSYCTNLTLSGITALLNNCPRLNHLSLTGVQAFLREDLLVFCREAPPEFNDHQRDVFCVFSGTGCNSLRKYLNEDAAHGGHTRAPFAVVGDVDSDDDHDDNDGSDVAMAGSVGSPTVSSAPPMPPVPPMTHDPITPEEQAQDMANMGLPPPAPYLSNSPDPFTLQNFAPWDVIMPLNHHPHQQHHQLQALPPLQIPLLSASSGSPTQTSPTLDAPLSVDEGEEFNEFPDPDEHQNIE